MRRAWWAWANLLKLCRLILFGPYADLRKKISRCQNFKYRKPHQFAQALKDYLTMYILPIFVCNYLCFWFNSLCFIFQVGLSISLLIATINLPLSIMGSLTRPGTLVLLIVLEWQIMKVTCSPAKFTAIFICITGMYSMVCRRGGIKL